MKTTTSVVTAGFVWALIGVGCSDSAVPESQIDQPASSELHASEERLTEVRANGEATRNSDLAAATEKAEAAADGAATKNTDEAAPNNIEEAATEKTEEAATKDTEDLATRIGELEAQIESLKKLAAENQESAQSKLSEQQRKTSELEKSMAATRELVNKYQAEIKDMKVTLGNNEQQLSRAKMEKTKLDKTALDLRTENARLQSEIDEKDARIKAMRVNLSKLSPNRLIEKELENYNKNPRKRVYIVYREGQRERAEAICKLLGLRVRDQDVDEVTRIIRAQRTQDMTVEALQVFDAFGSVFESVESGTGSFESNSTLLPFQRELPHDEQEDGDANNDQAQSDPQIGSDSFHDSRWYLKFIRAPEALQWWYRTTAAREKEIIPTTVAVIDSGVDIEHKDLIPFLWFKPGALERDREGFPDIHGQNFWVKTFSPKADSTDIDCNVRPWQEASRIQGVVDYIHGTHVTGLIISVANLKTKTRKEEQRPLRLMILKAREMDEIGDAVGYARRNGASIINISIAHKRYSRFLAREIRAFTTPSSKRPRGGLVVCAAGNATGRGNAQQLDNDQFLAADRFILPANLGHGEPASSVEGLEQDAPMEWSAKEDAIISVAAVGPTKIDEAGNYREFDRAAYSRYGSETVDLYAPGGVKIIRTPMGNVDCDSEPDRTRCIDPTRLQSDYGIYSTIPQGMPYVMKQMSETVKNDWAKPNAQYGTWCGTSQAAPLVAGAAAMIWSHPDYRRLKAHEIKALILDNVRRAGDKTDKAHPVGNDLKSQSGGVLDLGFLIDDDEPSLAEEDWLARSYNFAPRRPISGWKKRFGRFIWSGFGDLRSRKYEAALAHFDSAASEQPQEPAVYYLRAVTHAELGDYQLAEHNLRHALRLEHTNPLGGDWYRLMEWLQGPKRVQIEQIRRAFFQQKQMPFQLVSDRDMLDIWQFWKQPDPPKLLTGDLVPSWLRPRRVPSRRQFAPILVRPHRVRVWVPYRHWCL